MGEFAIWIERKDVFGSNVKETMLKIESLPFDISEEFRNDLIELMTKHLDNE